MTKKTFPTRAPKNLTKSKTIAKTDKLTQRIGELQNLFYAEGKHALLIILQGMDASGKDGVIKSVFRDVNPSGCRIVPFKKPTEIELQHDFLWRIHAHVPEMGMIHIFNRSHYEDVLIQRVHKWVDEKTVRQRFDHINNFEKLLAQSNTVILKFWLNVSKEKQLERLNERLQDKTKMWKYNSADMKERTLWKHYMKAYEDVVQHCSLIPWNVIPADQNWYKEFLIADVLCKALEGLKMKFPGVEE
jgi:PPK2 family polyphosphate:nucleotide phosphotransferase